MTTTDMQTTSNISAADPETWDRPVSLSVRLRVPATPFLVFSLALLIASVSQKNNWWVLDQPDFEVPYLAPLTYLYLLTLLCFLWDGIPLSWAEVSAKGITTRTGLCSSSARIPWSRVVAVQEKPSDLRLVPFRRYRYASILVRAEDGSLTKLRCPLENADTIETRRFQAAFASYWPDWSSSCGKAVVD
ncbi:hypothetical protein VWZ88_20200 [Phaeobacter sp. JH20_36]|uniref:hypothetical protein n=1 Tax=Phaeobacter TaxID=302485 RepID=UPI003A8AA0CB